MQIVGTLTGGSSYCSAPNDPDYYGKMSEHWDGNNNPTDDLKVFLDNANTNEETLFGNYAPDCDQEWLEAEEVQFSDLGIYPNPTAGDIRIELKRSFGLDRVTIYDTMGHLVEQRDLSQGQMELLEGIYFLTFQFDNGQQVTKKVTKM